MSYFHNAHWRAKERKRSRFGGAEAYPELTVDLYNKFSEQAFTSTAMEEDKKKMNSNGEFTRVSRKRGRKMRKNIKNIYKLTDSQRGYQIFRWQNMNPFFTSSHGANKLMYTRNTTNGLLYYPVHIYDLSTLRSDYDNNVGPINGNGSTGSGGIITVGSGPTISVGSATGIGLIDNNTNQGGTTAGTSGAWVSETLINNKKLSGSNDIMEWIEVRLLCYGRLSRPTRYRVELCQIPSEQYNPYSINSNVFNGTVLNPVIMTDAVAGWQAVMAPFGYNPLHKFDAQNNEKQIFKTIMSEDFILASDSADDGSDNIAKARQVNFFWRCNRRQNYGWQTGGGYNPVDIAGNDDDYVTQSGDLRNGPHYKSRIYLVVRAMSDLIEQAGAPTWSATSHPSYDIIIRKKHVGTQLFA